MSKAKVLIVDGDEWIARMLADGLRDRSFDVRVTISGTQGLKAAESVKLDCIVIDPHVPGLGGFAFIRTIRRSRGVNAKVPVIFMSSVDNDEGRSAAFQAGGDVYLTKPFRLQEVAIQVKALVRMARRIGSASDSVSTSLDSLPAVKEVSGAKSNAVEGDLEQMSLASLLTLLEMERRSGEVTVRSPRGLCMLDIAGGTIIGARLNRDTTEPLTAIAELLRWKQGRFQFKPGDLGLPVGTFRPIGQLLLEATRLLDEAAAKQAAADEVEQQGPPSKNSWPPPSTWAKRRMQTGGPPVSTEPNAQSGRKDSWRGRPALNKSAMIRRPAASPRSSSSSGEQGSK